MQTLTDAEVDAVSGGQVTAAATFNITNLVAAGAANATATADDVTVVAATTGGLAPSATAFVSAALNATSLS